MCTRKNVMTHSFTTIQKSISPFIIFFIVHFSYQLTRKTVNCFEVLFLIICSFSCRTNRSFELASDLLNHQILQAFYISI